MAGTAESLPRLSGRGLSLVRTIFTPLSFAAIASVLWISRDSIGHIISDSDFFWLLISAALWSFTHIIAPATGRFLFKACGVEVPYTTCLRIHCARLPAKYLPGGIWHSVGRANDYLMLGHTARRIGLFFLAENVLLVCCTFAVATPLIIHLVPVPSLVLLLQAGTLLAIAAIVLFPWVLKRLRSPELLVFWSGYGEAIATLLVYWMVAGLAFSAYIDAFPALELDTSHAEKIGVYVFSWCIGYLAIFAPQGVGVMEVVSGFLLNEGQMLQMAGLLAGFRLVVMFADLGTWLVMHLAGKRS